MASSQDWLFVTPISNLEIGKDLRQRIVIGRVEFIRADKLSYIRKKLGIPYRISLMRRTNPLFDGFIKTNETLALLCVKLKEGQDFGDIVNPCFSEIRKATAILSLSRCCYTRRRHRDIFGLGVQPARVWQSYFFIERGKGSASSGFYPLGGGQLEGAHVPFIMDGHWQNWHKKYGFFFDLLDILFGSKKDIIDHGWWKRLFRAALFAGQSWQTIDPVQAFLYNIFSLEALLLESGGKTEDLARRTEVFLGWAGFWGQDESFAEKVKDMHSVRHLIVHQADTSKFSLDHLLFSDDLIFNLFLNLAKHVELFKSQAKVIEFCRKIEAERILGLKPRVRPKSFRAMAPRYTDEDKAEI